MRAGYQGYGKPGSCTDIQFPQVFWSSQKWGPCRRRGGPPPHAFKRSRRGGAPGSFDITRDAVRPSPAALCRMARFLPGNDRASRRARGHNARRTSHRRPALCQPPARDRPRAPRSDITQSIGVTRVAHYVDYSNPDGHNANDKSIGCVYRSWHDSCAATIVPADITRPANVRHGQHYVQAWRRRNAQPVEHNAIGRLCCVSRVMVSRRSGGALVRVMVNAGKTRPTRIDSLCLSLASRRQAATAVMQRYTTASVTNNLNASKP